MWHQASSVIDVMDMHCCNVRAQKIEILDDVAYTALAVSR